MISRRNLATLALLGFASVSGLRAEDRAATQAAEGTADAAAARSDALSRRCCDVRHLPIVVVMIPPCHRSPTHHCPRPRAGPREPQRGR